MLCCIITPFTLIHNAALSSIWKIYIYLNLNDNTFKKTFWHTEKVMIWQNTVVIISQLLLLCISSLYQPVYIHLEDDKMTSRKGGGRCCSNSLKFFVWFGDIIKPYSQCMYMYITNLLEAKSITKKKSMLENVSANFPKDHKVFLLFFVKNHLPRQNVFAEWNWQWNRYYRFAKKKTVHVEHVMFPGRNHFFNIGSEHLELIDKFFRRKKGLTTGIPSWILYYGNIKLFFHFKQGTGTCKNSLQFDCLIIQVHKFVLEYLSTVHLSISFFQGVE